MNGLTVVLSCINVMLKNLSFAHFQCLLKQRLQWKNLLILYNYGKVQNDTL